MKKIFHQWRDCCFHQRVEGINSFRGRKLTKDHNAQTRVFFFFASSSSSRLLLPRLLHDIRAASFQRPTASSSRRLLLLRVFFKGPLLLRPFSKFDFCFWFWFTVVVLDLSRSSLNSRAASFQRPTASSIFAFARREEREKKIGGRRRFLHLLSQQPIFAFALILKKRFLHLTLFTFSCHKKDKRANLEFYMNSNSISCEPNRLWN